MTKHEMTVRAQYRDNLVVWCSCGRFRRETDEIPLERLFVLAQQHMEETFPARLLEEMNRPARMSAKDLGLSDDEAARLVRETS